MLGKRSQHLIRKVSELLVFGDGGGGGAGALLDTIGSPRSPLDHMNSSPKVPSPKGLKSYYDVGGAVGLGIVVALDKSEEARHNHAVQAIKHHQQQHQHGFFVNQQVIVGSPEDYTYVTYHEPNKTITKVYYDGGEGHEVGILRHGCDVKNNNNNNKVGVFRRNPPTTTQSTLVKAEPSYYPTSDFLSSCHLCRKKLHGKDIYMYRGEKGFCSTECRSRQIMMDEGKEQCRSEASRTVELSSSPYTRDQMFSTGIVAL